MTTLKVSSIETPPKPRPRGTVCIGKGKYGVKASKLAADVPAVVRTVDRQERLEAKLPSIMAKLVVLHNNANHNAEKRARIALAMRSLSQRMFGIEFAGTQYRCYVSANVLSDYKREGIEVVVWRKPATRKRDSKRARLALSTDASKILYLAEAKEARANNHACGWAQTAWRIAHAEGDQKAQDAAYAWLVDGTCEYLARLQSTSEGIERMRELFAAEYFDRRSNFHGSRRPHRMRPPTQDELAAIFSGNYRLA